MMKPTEYGLRTVQGLLEVIRARHTEARNTMLDCAKMIEGADMLAAEDIRKRAMLQLEIVEASIYAWELFDIQLRKMTP